MKTKDYLYQFQSAKKDFNQIVKQISYGKAVINNITDLIPAEWQLDQDHWGGDIRISPAEGQTLTVDKFDRFLSKLSRAFNVEPCKSINEKALHARFYIYRMTRLGGKYADYGSSVAIEISMTNTEKCEITYKRKMQKVSVLTGYCKALEEKKYLSVQSR